MQVHNSLKELLEAWEERRLEITFNNDYHAAKTMLKDFIASNSLASVEPEPLAKNKQTENEFLCYLDGTHKGRCKNHCGNENYCNNENLKFM